MITSTNVNVIDRLPNLRTLSLGRCQLAPADLHFVESLQRLEKLQLLCDEFLIEDIEPLAKLPALRTLEATITTTEDERRAFETAHPNLAIHWQPQTWWPNVDERARDDDVLEAWNVLSILFRRWQVEEGVQKPKTNNRWESVDFRDIRLTADRAHRIPPTSLAKCSALSFGLVDTAETMLELMQHCNRIEELDARYVPLTKTDLDRISFAPDSMNYMQQGALTVEDLCEFARQVRPNTLAIFHANMTISDAERIQNSSTDTMLEVYRGFLDDERESIYPEYELGPESPFE
jgi:hypothetical protein